MSNKLQNTLVFFIPVIVATIYSVFSQHIWEDGMISLRFARNIAEGVGPVYNAGERVFGFSSVFHIYTLALIDWLSPFEDPNVIFWVYRIVCFGLFGLTCLNVSKLLKASGFTYTWIWVALGLIFLDVKTIIYVSSGMEVAFVLFFISWALLLIRDGIKDRWVSVGVCAAALQYSRPDGFIYSGVLFGCAFLLGANRNLSGFFALIKSAALSMLIFLPWIIYTWIYFGSPIPHTVVSKAATYASTDGGLLTALWELKDHWLLILLDVLRPVYVSHLVHPFALVFTSYLTICACLLSLVFVKDSLAKICAIAFVLVCGYLTFSEAKAGMLFPWYCPPACFLAFVSCVFALRQIYTVAHNAALRRVFQGVLGVFFVVLLVRFAAGTIQMTTHQSIIENGIRKEIGLWLKNHAEQDDMVLLEPVGYIGYYSGLNIQDIPGLVSKRIIDLKVKHHNELRAILSELDPEWMVLRPAETLNFFEDAWVKEHYEQKQVFDRFEKLDSMPWIPGIRYHYFDAKYYIFRKKD